MSETQSQAIALRSSTDVASLDQFEEAVIYGNRIELLEDPETIQRGILMQLQAAQSDFELEPTEAEGWAELLDVPIEIHGFTWRPSDFDEGGSSVFVVVNGKRLDTGAPVVLTTGGRNVLMQLSNLARRGRFPLVRALRENEKPTRNGYKPLWLVTPEGYMLEADAVEEDEG
jgi:hypothetical protein